MYIDLHPCIFGRFILDNLVRMQTAASRFDLSTRMRGLSGRNWCSPFDPLTDQIGINNPGGLCCVGAKPNADNRALSTTVRQPRASITASDIPLSSFSVCK